MINTEFKLLECLFEKKQTEYYPELELVFLNWKQSAVICEIKALSLITNTDNFPSL